MLQCLLTLAKNASISHSTFYVLLISLYLKSLALTNLICMKLSVINSSIVSCKNIVSALQNPFLPLPPPVSINTVLCNMCQCLFTVIL